MKTLTALLVMALSPLGYSQVETTTPVGALVTPIPVGRTLVELPLQNYPVVKVRCGLVSAHTLTGCEVISDRSPGLADIAKLLPSDLPAYAEVLDGSLKGDRFEVDVPATRTSPPGTLVLLPENPLHSFPVGKIGNALTGSTISLHPHLTLSKVAGFCHPPLIGNDLPARADQIALASPDGKKLTAYFLAADGRTWRELGSGSPSNNVPIPPGTGLFLTKRDSPTALLQDGSVRTNDFAVNQPAGIHIPASPFAASPTAPPANAGPSHTNGAILHHTPNHETILINPATE